MRFFGLSTLMEDGTAGILESILGYLYDLWNIIPKFFYFLIASVLQMVDLCQALFRKLVGLDVYWVNGQETAESGDILLTLFKNIFLGEGAYKALNIAFWSITLLGLILLFVTTIAGILRSEYTQDKEKLNSKSGVVKNAFKGLISLILIPLTCYFCLFVGNAVLKAVDSATQTTASANVITSDIEGVEKWKTADGKETYAAYMLWGTELPTTFTPMSGIVFRATSYNANRIRRDESFYNKYINPNADSGFETNSNGETTNFNIFNQANSADEAASMVDEAFQLGMKVKTPAKLKDIGDPIEGINEGLFSEYGNITKFDRFNVGLVSYYYSLWHMDFLVAIIFVYFLIKLFLEVTLGLMQRLVEVVALLMFLPVVCAFMPVDNGEGFKKWRAHFITKTISGYVVIVSINIFFIIYPLFNAIQFFGPGWDVVNYMLTSIFLIAGMLSVKTVNSMFATMFTIDKINANVMDAGKNALTEGTSMIKQGAGTGLKIAKFATFPAALAAKHGFAALGKKIGDSGRTKHLNKGLDAGVAAANPGLTGTALETAQQQERTDYGRYQQSGEEGYINETIADRVRAEGVARGDDEATIRANIQAEQQAYRADPNIRDSSGNVKYAELNRQMTRFKAADSRMKTYDQKQQKKKEEQKGAKTVKGVTGTLLSLLTGGLVELPDDKKKK